MATDRVYWMKVYDVNEKLIHEGLYYSDCNIGASRSYYLNGKLREEGSYSGYAVDPVKGYTFVNCDFKKRGEWKSYSEDGKLTQTEVFP